MTNQYLTGRPRYVVVAPAVVATLIDGQDVYVYRGAHLPTSTSERQIEHLLERRMIEKVGTPS